MFLAGIFMFSASWVLAPAPAETTPRPAPRVLRFLTDFESPPFSFQEGANPAGFDIDLGEALGRELSAKIEWLPAEFDIPSYSHALDAGGADAALTAISITKTRQLYLDFTRPYFSTSLAVAVREDTEWSPVEFSALGLDGKVVGVMKGTTGEAWARKNLKATVKTYDSIVSLIGALKEGGNLSYAVVVDEAILKYLANRSAHKFKIVERDLGQEDYGIAVKRGNTKLSAELNSALKRVDKSGDYDRIYQKWFGKK